MYSKIHPIPPLVQETQEGKSGFDKEDALWFYEAIITCYLLLLVLYTISQSIWSEHIVKETNSIRDLNSTFFHCFWYFASPPPPPKIKRAKAQLFSSVFVRHCKSVRKTEIRQYVKACKANRSATYLSLKKALAQRVLRRCGFECTQSEAVLQQSIFN